MDWAATSEELHEDDYSLLFLITSNAHNSSMEIKQGQTSYNGQVSEYIGCGTSTSTPRKVSYQKTDSTSKNMLNDRYPSQVRTGSSSAVVETINRIARRFRQTKETLRLNNNLKALNFLEKTAITSNFLPDNEGNNMQDTAFDENMDLSKYINYSFESVSDQSPSSSSFDILTPPSQNFQFDPYTSTLYAAPHQNLGPSISDIFINPSSETDTSNFRKLVNIFTNGDATDGNLSCTSKQEEGTSKTTENAMIKTSGGSGSASPSKAHDEVEQNSVQQILPKYDDHAGTLHMNDDLDISSWVEELRTNDDFAIC